MTAATKAMTDEEYYRKMNQANHSNTCSWGWDQYWWECDCGTIPVAELKSEQERRRAYAQPPAHHAMTKDTDQ